MYEFYVFDFLETVTDQLYQRLLEILHSPLDEQNLSRLGDFQNVNGSVHGVYLLHLDRNPIYVGKANNVRSRLTQHLNKLSGRQIEMQRITFKAIILGRSMNTAANENLLMVHFRNQGMCGWNGLGFGSKDPGDKREDSAPSVFDLQFPIRRDFVLNSITDNENIGSALMKMKEELPFLLRWDRENLTPTEMAMPLNLEGCSRIATELLCAIAQALGTGWQAVVFPSHMIIYKNNVVYRHGERIFH